MSSLISHKELKRLRELAGLSQRKLAKLAGVSQALIARIEKGKVNPRLSTLNKILNALNKALNISQTAESIMTSPVITVTPNTPLKTVINIMDIKGISQIPVVNEGKVVGTIFESSILKVAGLRRDIRELKAKDVMEDPLPMVPPLTSIDVIKALLLATPAVLVVDREGLKGIITKIDLIKYLTLKPIETQNLHKKLKTNE